MTGNREAHYRDRECPHGHPLPHHPADRSRTKAVRLVRQNIEQVGIDLVRKSNDGDFPSFPDNAPQTD